MLKAFAIALAVLVLALALVGVIRWRRRRARAAGFDGIGGRGDLDDLAVVIDGVAESGAPLALREARDAEAWGEERASREATSEHAAHDHGAPLPIVLVHGLFGFDRIGLPGAKLDYFRGIRRQLEALGGSAHAVRLPPAASVPDRARALVAALAELPHPRVDVIAHSLGGLDARYALTHLGLASRVRSLVTVGTPHRGTPLADLAIDGPLDWARRVASALGIPLAALEWLGVDALARFNAQVHDAPGVRYACVVGGLHGDASALPLALVPSHAYLRRVAGPNDGLVPIASQYWGEPLAEIEADHFAQIGWQLSRTRTFDAAALYAFVVARLAEPPHGRPLGPPLAVR